MNILEEITGLVSDKIIVFKTIISIIKLETRLAGASVYPLLINFCLLLIVMMTTWLLTTCGLGYLLFLVFNNTLIAIIATLLINLFFCLGLLKYLMFNLKRMSFEKTRKYLLSKESDQDDQQEKATHYSDCNERKRIEISST